MNSATIQKVRDELLAYFDEMDDIRKAQLKIIAAALAKDFPRRKTATLTLVRSQPLK